MIGLSIVPAHNGSRESSSNLFFREYIICWELTVDFHLVSHVLVKVSSHVSRARLNSLCGCKSKLESSLLFCCVALGFKYQLSMMLHYPIYAFPHESCEWGIRTTPGFSFVPPALAWWNKNILSPLENYLSLLVIKPCLINLILLQGY